MELEGNELDDLLRASGEGDLEDQDAIEEALSRVERRGQRRLNARRGGVAAALALVVAAGTLTLTRGHGDRDTQVGTSHPHVTTESTVRRAPFTTTTPSTRTTQPVTAAARPATLVAVSDQNELVVLNSTTGA